MFVSYKTSWLSLILMVRLGMWLLLGHFMPCLQIFNKAVECLSGNNTPARISKNGSIAKKKGSQCWCGGTSSHDTGPNTSLSRKIGLS